MTAAPDPLLTSAREIIERSHQEMRDAVQGLPPEALNWRPAGDDSNSIAVLVTHSLNGTRYWLSTALGLPPPPRDRDAEFEATASGAPALLEFVDDVIASCLAVLDPSRAIDWTSLRSSPPQLRPVDDEQVSSAWALLHALEHLREHVGQMMLTRQLWERMALS